LLGRWGHGEEDLGGQEKEELHWTDGGKSADHSLAEVLSSIYSWRAIRGEKRDAEIGESRISKLDLKRPLRACCVVKERLTKAVWDGK